MPSALEKLVKILRLEQETGYKNTAVIGGLESYISNWTHEAHQQARTNEHHGLVEELAKVVAYYSGLADKEERYTTVRYMLGRITNRVDPNPEFAVEWTDADTAKLPVGSSENPTPAKQNQSSSKPRNIPSVKAPQPQQSQDDDNNNGDDTAHDVLNELEFVEIVPDFADDVIPDYRREPYPKPRRAKRPDINVEEAFSPWQRLETPIKDLKGVGKRRAEQLNNLNIFTIGDLLFNFPRRYDDYTQVLPLGKITPMQRVTAVGTIAGFDERYTRDKRRYLRVVLEDKTGTFPLVFFGQNHLKKYFRPGMQIAVYGTTEMYLGKPQMTNPDWEEIQPNTIWEGTIVPIYGLTKGLSNKVLRNLIEQAIQDYGIQLPDYVPLSVLERTELVDFSWALRQVHFPENQDYLKYAQERLAFDDLLVMQLGVLAKRHEWQSVDGIPLHVDDAWLEKFADGLPYELTGAQIKAVEAIRHDVSRDVPMNRLLQGDVGAGKTVVAALALGMAVANGYQAAIMAPTSILAEQHYQGIVELISNCMPDQFVPIRLLTGATPAAERKEIYEGLADGSIQIVIGTHALIQEKLEFANLALAVIDEQHRFGVNERGSLRGKGNNPHVLVMTATPIPRTLALTVYADLDLTVLDEMPPGRTPIRTRVVSPEHRERAYDFIRDEIDQGRQAYIIYPLVEASETIQARSAVESYEELSQSDFYEYRLGLLHGRLNPSEKDEIMHAFANHELDVLVSTTVIEVGINVPNATVMMIEGANRFGLAQLHQLRGRVGRGQHQSYCFLLADTKSLEAQERLDIMEQTTDGFELARKDWEIRGPGDLLGTRQAGSGSVSLENMMDVQLVEMVQMESRAIFEEDPTLDQPEHALLAERIVNISRRHTDIS